jgi:signal transduction histidine kinase
MSISFVTEPFSKNRAAVNPAGGATESRELASGGVREASGSRRRDADADGPASAPSGARGSRFHTIRSLQVRSVGIAFLRARPLVVAPVAGINALLLAQSGAPVAQRVALATAIGAALLLFVLERWWLRRAEVGERWLAASLVATVAMLALGCALSGGVASPLLPLVLAPVVIAAAAFGRRRLTILTSVLAFVLVGALALLPPDVPFAPIPDPWRRAMLVTAFGGLLALCYAGVAGLVGAYVRTGELLERMRVATIEEAAGRMRATEQVGAKLAHELKNPLAAIKALLQILRDRVDDRGAKRLEVALAEVDRMHAIVRDYLSFARPLADLELAPVDLRALADDVVTVLADRARLAGVVLATTGASVAITGDSRRLREALFNLTDNAIAATPAGGTVTLGIVREQTAAIVRVEDTGSGMDPALADAPAFTTTRPEGTGLGLVIARGAITQHGGELRFTPRPDGGTIAHVHLPIHLGTSAEAP